MNRAVIDRVPSQSPQTRFTTVDEMRKQHQARSQQMEEGR